MTPREIVSQINKLIRKLPNAKLLVRTDEEEYPFKEVSSLSEEKLLFNGDDIQFDVGDEPGEHQKRGKAIVINLH